MEKGTVLIIEDNWDIREGIRILLQSEGYGVEEAAFAAVLCYILFVFWGIRKEIKYIVLIREGISRMPF